MSSTAHPEASPNIDLALAKIETYITEKMGITGVPGVAIGVVYQGKTVRAKGYGARNSVDKTTVSEDTVFQLASMSKPISSTVLAGVVGDRTDGITWDSLIKDLDSEFKLSDDDRTKHLTIRDLYCHRSGVPGKAGNDLEEMGFGGPEILRRLRYLSLGPRSYDYCNFGLTEGAVAVSKRLGLAWNALAQTRLFNRLGMTHTSASYQGFLDQKNRASLHIEVDGKWFPKLVRDASAQSAAGGISSSVTDLVKWMQLQLSGGIYNGNRVIDKAALDETHQPTCHMPSGSDYGLGWVIDTRDCQDFGHQPRWNHAGAFAYGTRTAVTLLPKLDLGIVVLSNAFPTGLPDAIIDTFFDYAFTGTSEEDWLKTWDDRYAAFAEQAVDQMMSYPVLEKPVPPGPLHEYEGTYSNDYFGDMKVRIFNGQLQLRTGPSLSYNFTLTPYNRDVFVYFGAPENPYVPYGIQFERDMGEGPVKRFELRNADIPEVSLLFRV